MHKQKDFLTSVEKNIRITYILKIKHRTENIGEDKEPHDFDWNNIQILHKENNLYKRLFAEMIYIKKEKENSLNKITDTDSYSNSYNVIIDFLKSLNDPLILSL